MAFARSTLRVAGRGSSTTTPPTKKAAHTSAAVVGANIVGTELSLAASQPGTATKPAAGNSIPERRRPDRSPRHPPLLRTAGHGRAPAGPSRPPEPASCPQRGSSTACTAAPMNPGHCAATPPQHHLHRTCRTPTRHSQPLAARRQAQPELQPRAEAAAREAQIGPKWAPWLARPSPDRERRRTTFLHLLFFPPVSSSSPDAGHAGTATQVTAAPPIRARGRPRPALLSRATFGGGSRRHRGEVGGNGGGEGARRGLLPAAARVSLESPVRGDARDGAW